MTEMTMASCLIFAVFLAGALRAWIDKRIEIFAVSTGVTVVFIASAVLEHFGLWVQWVEYLFVVLLILLGVSLDAICASRDPEHS